MKKILQLGVILFSFFFILSSCGKSSNSTDPITYMNKANELMTSINNLNTNEIKEVRDAIRNQDFDKATKAVETFKKSLDDKMAIAEKLGSLNGDNTLQESFKTAINGFQTTVTDYSEVIKVGKEGGDYSSIQNKIQNTFIETANNLNKALGSFVSSKQ